MPKSNFQSGSRLKRLNSSLAAFVLAAALQACFDGGGDSDPHTVFKGERFSDLHLEIEADGNILLLAQTRMFYAHRAPVQPWDSNLIERNMHSILYRRSKGGWDATPFKNLQRDQMPFPALVPDQGGKFQALVWDTKFLKRYGFRDGAWKAMQVMNIPPEARSFGYMSPVGNWQRHPNLAWQDDSAWVMLHTPYNGGPTRAIEQPGNRAVLLDSGRFWSQSFHVAGKTRAAVGYLEPRHRQGRTDDPGMRLAYYHWRAGDSAAVRASLPIPDSGFVADAYFAPFKGRTALFMSDGDGLGYFPLKDDGSLGDLEFIETPEDVHFMRGLLAVDSAGCLHGLEAVRDTSGLRPNLFHWSTCSPETDTLKLTGIPQDKRFQVFSIRLRIGSDGNPVAALGLEELPADMNIRIVNRVYPSWLVFARREAGGWVAEVVDSR